MSKNVPTYAPTGMHYQASVWSFSNNREILAGFSLLFIYLFYFIYLFNNRGRPIVATTAQRMTIKLFY